MFNNAHSEINSAKISVQLVLGEDAYSMITVTIKLFAAYQDAFATPELVLTLPDATTVGAVRDRLIQEHPELAQWRDLTRFGVNLEFVEAQTPLHDGDELVLIPPVSGG